MTDTKPPIIKRRSEVRTKTTATTSTIATPPHIAGTGYTATTQAVVAAARDKANNAMNTAREWLTPSSEWSSFTHLESLSTVMFSPLAAHPVYRSESMVKALQLMQQQQRSGSSSTNTSISSSNTDLVLHGKMYAWPSSAVLLQADIPESSSPVSLFQGFAAAYPSLAKPSSARSSPKRSRQRKKKVGSPSGTPINRKGIISRKMVLVGTIPLTTLILQIRPNHLPS